MTLQWSDATMVEMDLPDVAAERPVRALVVIFGLIRPGKYGRMTATRPASLSGGVPAD
jgi:hypothetical protein